MAWDRAQAPRKGAKRGPWGFTVKIHITSTFLLLQGDHGLHVCARGVHASVLVSAGCFV